MLCFEAEKAQGKSLEHWENTWNFDFTSECGHPGEIYVTPL